MDDDVSIDELREAVEHMHGVPATFVESVDVDERFQGAIIWQGTVKVFALAGHRARRGFSRRGGRTASVTRTRNAGAWAG